MLPLTNKHPAKVSFGSVNKELSLYIQRFTFDSDIWKMNKMWQEWCQWHNDRKLTPWQERQTGILTKQGYRPFKGKEFCLKELWTFQALDVG